MNAWQLLPTVSAPMPFQLALDEILFSEMQINEDSPFFRFYFSSEPWVTVGYSYENPKGRVGERAKGRISRRMTGGGVVKHGQDLLFSLIAHKRHDDSFHSVRTSYWKIHEVVKLALENLGASPRFYRCDENLTKGKDCFLFPIATDLAVGRKKIAGGAQKRSSGAMLHQESIQIAGMDDENLSEALKSSFEKIFSVRLEPSDFNHEWLEAAEGLAKEKYAPRNRVYERT